MIWGDLLPCSISVLYWNMVWSLQCGIASESQMLPCHSTSRRWRRFSCSVSKPEVLTTFYEYEKVSLQLFSNEELTLTAIFRSTFSHILEHTVSSSSISKSFSTLESSMLHQTTGRENWPFLRRTLCREPVWLLWDKIMAADPTPIITCYKTEALLKGSTQIKGSMCPTPGVNVTLYEQLSSKFSIYFLLQFRIFFFFLHDI